MRGFDLADLAEVTEVECRYPQVQVDVGETRVDGLFDHIVRRLRENVSAQAAADFQREVFDPWRKRVNRGGGNEGVLGG